jgi:hypothetical protein
MAEVTQLTAPATPVLACCRNALPPLLDRYSPALRSGA